MSIRQLSIDIVTILAISLLIIGHSPFLRSKQPPGQTELPVVGKWSVEFANGVRESWVVRADGTARVVEPLRTSDSKASWADGTIFIKSDDDRVERWTVIGRRVVVEHWFPASEFPT